MNIRVMVYITCIYSCIKVQENSSTHKISPSSVKFCGQTKTTDEYYDIKLKKKKRKKKKRKKKKNIKYFGGSTHTGSISSNINDETNEVYDNSNAAKRHTLN